MTIFQFSFGDGFAGSAKVALESSRLLKEKGHNVILFVSLGSLTADRAGEYGLKFYPLNDKMKYKELIAQVSSYYTEHKPDMVIGHHSLDRKIGISLKRKYPAVKNIAYRHNITKSLPIIGSFIYNRYTDALIACSKGVEDSLVKSGIKKHKIKTLYNGITIPANLNSISGEEVKQKYNLKNKTVLGLSTWFHKERKGFDILFNAFSGMDSSYILLLVGIPDNQQKEVIDFAREFNIAEERLVMPGYVENIWEYYKAMDIFLLPSRSEGFSLALLEAAAAGLPIIASNIPGNNEFVEDRKNGILFDINQPEMLRKNIAEINENKSLSSELASAARKKVYDNYTIERYADNLDKFLNNMLLQKSV
jgi:glycosyltransferase involved in cell wall biosynthesis